MPTPFLPERTVKYKTYVKRAVVEAFKAVFQHHIDELLSRTNVTIDFPRKDSDYPALLVRFYERDLKNMGVGHVEHIAVDGPTGQEDPNSGVYAFKHYLYHGDLEFSIKGLSSLDRDLIADSVVQTLGMGTLESYTNRFFDRIYPDEASGKYPDAIWHYVNINTDEINGFGESQSATPWQSEDDLIYEVSYRTPVFGEFYSVPPNMPKEYVQKVVLYPYIAGVEPVPQGDPNQDFFWQPPAGI